MKYLTNKKGQGEWIGNTAVIIIGVFVLFQLVKALVASDPSFARYGWAIFGALVIGVIAYFKRG